jgi:hypothetical protein
VELSTREIAIAIWLTIGLAWGLTHGPVRQSVLSLLSALLHWKILAPILFVISYVVVIVVSLRYIGLWNIALLKDTILWLLFSGLALALSAFQIHSAVPTWRTILKEQVQVIIIIEFLLNTYTFKLWIELLLIPTLVFVAMLDTVARMDNKYVTVARMTGFLQSALALSVLGFALRRAFNAPPTDAVAVARELLLPVLLSLSLLPIVYFYFLASAYEQLFLMVSLGSMDAQSQRYAKWKLLRRTGLRPSVAKEYFARYSTKPRQARSTAEIDSLLN